MQMQKVKIPPLRQSVSLKRLYSENAVHACSLPVIAHTPTSPSLPSSQALTVVTSTQISVSEDYCSEQQPV